MTPRIIYDDDVVVPFLNLINHPPTNSLSTLNTESSDELIISTNNLNDDKLIRILQKKPIKDSELFVYGDEFVDEHVLIENQEIDTPYYLKIPHRKNRINALSKGGVLCIGNIENQVKSLQSTVLDLDEHVEKIESGSWHTLLLTNKNRIFAMGKNLDGQLDIQSTILATGYRHILLFCLEDEIKDIACGKRNSMILIRNGRLFGVGYNIYGQIGCETETGKDEEYCRVNMLTKTNIEERVRSIACGSYHTVMITRDNNVYFCGETYGGVDIKIPTRITYFDTLVDNGDYVNFVSCGELHTIFLTKKGIGLTMGRNSYGQLGLQDFKSRSEVTPIDMCHFNNQPIHLVASGWNHTLFLTRNNQLYSSGRNKHGQLGTGDFLDKNVPTRIIINNETITSIHAGRACSIFGSKSGNFYLVGISYFESIEGEICVPQRISLPSSFHQHPAFNYQLFTSAKSRCTYLTKNENTRLVWTFARLKRRMLTDFYTDLTIITSNPTQIITIQNQEIVL